MDLQVAERHCTDDLGQPRQFRYYLTVDLEKTSRFSMENYGVRIAEDGGDTSALPGLTTSASRIDELMTLLVDNLVGPAGLADVVADWL